MAERDRAHLTIPFVVDMLPHKIKRIIASLVAVLSIGLLVYMARLGYRLAEMAQYKVTQILKVSGSGLMSPFRSVPGNGSVHALLVN